MPETKAWARRWIAVLAVLGAVGLVFSLSSDAALAQAPPAPPHTFFGGTLVGADAEIDGELVHNGAVVTAFNQDGEAVRASRICKGVWIIEVTPGDAETVVFNITAGGGSSTLSGSFDVVPGGLNAVALDLDSGGGSRAPRLGKTDCSIARRIRR